MTIKENQNILKIAFFLFNCLIAQFLTQFYTLFVYACKFMNILVLCFKVSVCIFRVCLHLTLYSFIGFFWLPVIIWKIANMHKICTKLVYSFGAHVLSTKYFDFVECTTFFHSHFRCLNFVSNSLNNIETQHTNTAKFKTNNFSCLKRDA